MKTVISWYMYFSNRSKSKTIHLLLMIKVRRIAAHAHSVLIYLLNTVNGLNPGVSVFVSRWCYKVGHVQRTNFITSSTDKYYSLDSEDDFYSGCRNVSHQQQFFSELPSPGRSHNTNYLLNLLSPLWNIRQQHSATPHVCFTSLSSSMTVLRQMFLALQVFFTRWCPGQGSLNQVVPWARQP